MNTASIATSLDVALTPERVSDRVFSLSVADGWQQGKGAFGGLVVGSMVRAMDAFLAQPTRTLRSLTAEIVGPVLVGPARIEVEALRQGNAVSTLRATLLQGDEVLAHTVGVFGAPRAGASGWQLLSPPALPPPGEIEPLPHDSPFAPIFTRHFEYRTVGPFPFSGAEGTSASGWIKARAPSERRDAAYLAALADAWWLAGTVSMASPRPVATLAFSLDLPGDTAGLPLDAPLFHRASAPAASDGYISEYRELWGPDGRLIALNHQVVVVIKLALFSPGGGLKASRVLCAFRR